jgi:transposase
MSKVSVFVGLDYHQSSVQVCVLDAQGNPLINATRSNHWREIADVVPRNTRVFAAIEACCGAADLAEELIHKAGWSVDLAHAGYVARIKQSPDKTDFSDARLLADLERVGYLPKVWLAPENVRELRRLVRYRQQLSQQHRSVKLRVRALLRDQRVRPPAGVNPWTRAWLAWVISCEELGETSRWILQRHLEELKSLKTQLREVEQRLAAQTRNDPVVQALLAEEGVGLITAVTLRAEIGRFDRFRTGKQLARFCSVTPRNASSGTRQADAGLIRAGNPELRRVLIETAHRLAWRSKTWSRFAGRMKERGKSPCVIAAAIANRWIRGLYYDMKAIAA